MAAVLYVQGALLWLHLTQACEQIHINQEPQVLVTITGNSVPIDCGISYTNIDIGTTIFSAVDRDNPAGTYNRNEQSVAITDTNGTTTVSHSVQANGQSAMYYCVVTCGTSIKSGIGTYIHVIDNGYVKPTDPSSQLQSSLIALLVLLLLLSATGTSLLLLPFIWKRKGGSPPKPPRGLTSVSPKEDKEASSSVYESLKPCPDSELYLTLEKAPPLPKGKVINVATHQSPKSKASPKVKPIGAQELTRGGSKKPPVKPKPKRSHTEQDLYENVHQ
ncbi:uncharacterized protein LOC108703565 [Xenopus laevis]|uniref:Uncharacterized protein LOC108703565 n=1 Tax=Xenopus laevis TaxID=8355 RepID=A0A8J0U5D6_XENLA|nr:uncharacterized protein LOC108703565 [Xenopus laevis]OCT59591.1 hypothetical protein XELAEV_18001013mg [Xenopus laevis]